MRSIAGFFVGLALGFIGEADGASAPAIMITNLPAYGSSAHLGGIAVGVSPSQYAVVVFIYIPGAGWWSKPTCPGQPLTPIQADGSWVTDITTGGSDPQATRVAALLVGTNYNQPCVLGETVLSSNIYAQAVAKAIVTRPSPGVRFVHFSNYDWWVKTGSGLLGPGPNYFSDSTNSVWVDTNGFLHLRVNQTSNQWQCAEIISARTLGYGSYRFELDSIVDNLDPNIVLGLFTWSDDPAYTDREIDIEASRWSNIADANNTQFVLQPFSGAGHLQRYRTPAGLADSTHLFVWQSNQVNWEALVDSYSPAPAAGSLISTFAFLDPSQVPQTGDESVHINFWLINGAPPANGQPSEFVLKSFQFVPLGQPAPPTLTTVSDAGGYLQFIGNSQMDWWYSLQSSGNLIDWRNVSTLAATNNTITFQAPLTSQTMFYRIVTIP